VPELFANLATTARRTVPAVVNHYNIQQAFDVYAQPDGRDLGGVASDIDGLVTQIKPKLPRGSSITVRGQVQNMRSAFTGLIGGILAALILVFIILMINFQTVLDPLVIIIALPGAVAGVLWALFVTPYHVQRPVVDGDDHGNRRRHVQQRAAHHVRG